MFNVQKNRTTMIANRLIPLAMLLMAVLTVYARQESDDYRLVWSDEFDRDGKPSEQWTPEQGFVRNEELQWYQADNAYVSNGCLVIEARRERVANPNHEPDSRDWRRRREAAEYTSSCLTTQHSFCFMYGRVEVCAKIPVASGAWPAIWLLGNQWTWPENGEVDMLEFYRAKGVPSILANTCWGSPRPYTPVWDSTLTPLTYFTDRDSLWTERFHLWRMDWDESYIRLYIDDELLNETDLSQTVNGGAHGNTENPFTTRQAGFGAYLLLNLAIGSNGGQPDHAAFPMQYMIDYVRVYQRTR